MNIQANKDYYFNQNITAAQEGALLARLNRIKSSIGKLKVSLTTVEHNSTQYNEIDQELFAERTRYFQVLTQLNRVRARTNDLEQIDQNNDEEQFTQNCCNQW